MILLYALRIIDVHRVPPTFKGTCTWPLLILTAYSSVEGLKLAVSYSNKQIVTP